jgi:Tfp pilus assembly pilus retraction ATPase PilT
MAIVMRVIPQTTSICQAQSSDQLKTIADIKNGVLVTGPGSGKKDTRGEY